MENTHPNPNRRRMPRQRPGSHCLTHIGREDRAECLRDMTFPHLESFTWSTGAGDLSSGVDGERVWITYSYGAVLVRVMAFG